jgi:iron complex transport system substrate-binding protein
VVNRKKSFITEAKRFTLIKTDSCTVFEVLNPWQGADNVSQVFYLKDRYSKKSCRVDTEKLIYVPVRKIICMSTTHLAMIKALNEEKTVCGVSGTGFIYDREISENIKNGLISDVGYEAALNNELIISLSPDLIMMYGIGSESMGYVGKLIDLGVKVMFNADYLEEDPLGKAEWIKLFGALYCKEEAASDIFNNILREYNKIKVYIDKNTVARPDVLLGLPFRDTWYVSPGNSYISRLINDAGGNYLWSNSISSVSMPMSIENVYLGALKAEFWLNIGMVNSMNEITAIDPRLGNIPCFRMGNLFNNNKRITSAGGNDYWESGTLNPQIILKDIASVLHPELFEDKELFYYKRIE